MNRRDFLLLRTNTNRRVLELSCQYLYVRHVDIQALGRGEHADARPPSEGEPPAVFEERTTDQLFEGLDRDLGEVDVLRIVNRDWLVSEDLRRQLDALVKAFRARGGTVEYCS